MATELDDSVTTSVSFTVYLPERPGQTEGSENNALVVWKWQGREALSDTYRFEIDLVTENLTLNYRELLGCRARLQVHGQGRSTWHGVLTQVLLSGVETAGEEMAGVKNYMYLRVTLEPQMALLRHEVVSRVHALTEEPQRKELSSLIRHALRGCRLQRERPPIPDAMGSPAEAFDYTIRLDDRTESWAEQDFFFQFKESTFDFLSRHLEDRGVYYWFEQGERQEEVVFCDGSLTEADAAQASTAAAIPVTWQAKESLRPDTSGAVLFRLAHHYAMSPSTVEVNSFNPNAARLDLKVKAEVPQPDHAGAYHNWGRVTQFGGNHQSRQDGERLARLRVEEEVCRRNRYEGVGLASEVHAGATLRLKHHPLAELNRDFLVVAALHEGEQALPHKVDSASSDGVLRMRSQLTLLPADIQFRPERLTRRPYVSGMVSAVVEAMKPAADADVAATGTAVQGAGPGQDENQPERVSPYLDDKGRYRIRFLCAENAKGDTPGRNSAWVRMATPYAGRSTEQDGDFGMYFPLKEQAEVLVAFIDGDPDRPVIVAAVPNSQNLALSTNKNDTNLVSGFVMPTGNILGFMNKDKRQTIVMGSPVGDSYVVMGGDADKSDNRGILISTADHISLVAKSTKTIVEGKGFDRVYSLLPDTSEAKTQADEAKQKKDEQAAADKEKKSKENYAVGQKGKFEKDWLHPDSGWSYGIQKPKVSLGANLETALGIDFSVKLGFSLGLKVAATYSFEFSHNKTYNFLQKEVTEKTSDLKIQKREVKAIEDTLIAGRRQDIVLKKTGQYGAYRAMTKGVHHIEAVGGLLLSAVESLSQEVDEAFPDEMSAANTVASQATTLASVLAGLNPLNLKKTLKKLRPKEAADVTPAMLQDIVDRSREHVLTDREKSYLALSDDGVLLGTEGWVSIDAKKDVFIDGIDVHVTARKQVLMQAGAVKSTVSEADGMTLDGGGQKSVTLKTGGKSIVVSSGGVDVTAGPGLFKADGKVVKLG